MADQDKLQGFGSWSGAELHEEVQGYRDELKRDLSNRLDRYNADRFGE
ncbi:hypothetical protein [Haloterrigena alkaliphila]|uniref:Uncharacterized protein n=1 Tax=Haloterrigena alkaliphila TaxID=2816475 RepID=A0A8A2VGG7_9EURY|nr:hypothetical protein [Haloterrigena alkaliphila]QSX00427.1 hypothetical protein J0X25_05515 [Haloterrigena alkaliphila]